MNLILIDTGIPILSVILSFLFIVLLAYPVLGGVAWFVGAFCYTYLFKHKQTDWVAIPTEIEPLITIMVPAHNEEIVIEDTVTYLMQELHYTNYEVLVTDDGSTDSTPQILERLLEKYEKLRVVRIEKNKGKAHAFNVGANFAKGELILSNDADTLPEADALWKYVNYFIRQDGRNIAAVTSNMDVQNRSTIVGKSQTVEFSSIVGIIKRTQASVFGAIYAYSGANTMYRKDALIDVGMFRQDRATEDISIAWDHQFEGWVAHFAADIVFFMEVPETLNMLYKQRKRWAKGGTEVWLTNFRKVAAHPFANIGRTALFTDQTLSITWTLFFWVSTVLFVTRFAYTLFTGDIRQVLFMLAIAFVFVCFEMLAGILQLLASLSIDSHGKKLKYFLFSPLYLLFYWMMNAITILTTLIPAIKTILGFGTGVWISPERRKK
ncbi:glycosyltransferase family 2 protein [Listeria booriae]|uniref:glycosyltransferase family 2 protein n=1 Tax=Listeria booriae TaxID=1552123 RepID=UPI001627D393|nr:glycosyltransferase [Listeria booriae]MBC1800106.1 glycosyltransferase [Listeria booriae]MBC1813610.1 glycosyltransferase [Listeria booriae]